MAQRTDSNGSRLRHSFPQAIEMHLLLESHTCVLLGELPSAERSLDQFGISLKATPAAELCVSET